MTHNLASFTDVLGEDNNSQPISLPSSTESNALIDEELGNTPRPPKGTGQKGEFRSVEEIVPKYRHVFTYPLFNLVQSRVLEDALYSDKSMVVCAPTGSGKTVIFEMAIVHLLMELDKKRGDEDFKIIYMAPVKALCTEKLTEWYPKFTKLGLLCIEVTGDTDVDFSQLKPYRLIITTPEKWDMLTRRWRDHKSLVEVVKLFLIDEVHILNDEVRGPVLEAVVSRMKTIESSAQSEYRIEQLQKEIQGGGFSKKSPPSIRFVAVSATVSNPEDVAAWLGTDKKPAVFYKFGDECRPVKLNRIVEGYQCTEGTSIFKFDIILNYKLWPIIQKYHRGKPTLIFCNTRKSVLLTAETLSRELTVSFNTEQKAKLTALASTLKNKKLQGFVLSGVGCHHAGLLFEERTNIERAFRNRDLPILITTTTLAMGVNLPAHLVIIKNTQQYVNGAYQEYSISTVLQMVGRAGRPQFDTEATAVIMTRAVDKHRYQALVGGSEPLQSYLHRRLAENLNSEAALGTVGDVAQCVQWLRSTFLFVRAAKDPKRYLGLPQNSPPHLISKKIEELCVKAMNGLASSGVITMDDASCIQSTEAGRLMSIFYLDLETMKLIMKIQGTESLERLLWLICESHELADMHLRVDERRCLNALNRNNAAATIRFPMKGKINSRQMKLNCVIQAILGCLPIPDPSLGQEAMKIMRIADRVCKCVASYVTRPDFIGHQPEFYTAALNTIVLAKCISAHLWENSHFVSKQLKGIGPTFSTLLASAGKVNFMLLEESHPRDLERIMNKGPPAGNVLRKQISLLPKYQLTLSPVDENTVTLQLVLLNHSHLIENMDQLTAGESHKSYIIVGDSYNHILLLKYFKDKDLMCLYDGIMKYEIKRKHHFEHKIFAHCISSSFVGVDVQSEYLFNDLEHLFGSTVVNVDTQSKKPLRQRCITETFKERKRKGDSDITQSKEKKKRDNNIMEKFKCLKESFEYNASRDFKVHPRISSSSVQTENNINKPKATNFDDTTINLDEDNGDGYIDDDKIDNLLNEIENEIAKSRPKQNDTIDKSKALIASETSFNNYLSVGKSDSYTKLDKGVSLKRKSKPITNKSNYNFIDLLEKNTDLSDEEDTNCGLKKHNGFSETIKDHINQYLQVTETKTKVSDTNLEILLEESEIHQSRNAATETIHLNKENVNVSDDIAQYKIKEIVEPKITKTISNGNSTKHHEDQYVEKISKQNTMQDEIHTNYINDKENVPYPKILEFDLNIAKNETSSNLAPFCYLNNNKDIVQQNLLSKDSTRCIGQDIVSNVSNKFELMYAENIKKNDNGNYNHSESFARPQIIESQGFLNDEDKEMDHGNNLHDLKLNDIIKRPVTLIDDKPTKDVNPYEITIAKQCGGALFCEHINKPTIYNNVYNSSICENPSIEALHSNYTLIESPKDTSITLKNEFLNKYSYSATNIDVCTKTLPEHSIHVIRKVKLDVDITEIISRKKDLSHDALNTQVNFNKYPHQQGINELQRYVQDVSNNDNIKTNYKKSDQINKNLETEISSDLQKDERFTVKLDDTRNCMNVEDEELNEELKEFMTLGSPKGSDTLFMEKTRANIQTNLGACAEDIKQNDESLVRNENNVKNILQKYRKILGTEPLKDVYKDNIPSKLPDVSISQRVKPKRPFKIGDIHKLSVPFPDDIIHDTTDDRTTEYDDIVSADNIVVHNTFDAQEERSPMACHQIPDIDIPEHEMSHDYMEVSKADVEDINSETNEDINIDQTMLDPKTLLQSVVGENELIPPPPEFRDETDYTPEYEFDHEYLGPPDEIKYDESIFDDDTATELTPSKEIETWTLTREDSCDNSNVVQFNSPKSFTMMRKNTLDLLTMQDAFVPRRARLGKFKFNIKSKLRVKK